MRNISAASLAKLSQKTGTEPVVIIECEWNRGQLPAVYGDKRVDGVDPRILQINDLNDVMNVNKTGTSQSVTITLDDTDGELKNIFNNVDFHKKNVSIYQWFTGIELSEKFLLFAGQILTPVTWKEGDRTLTFVVSSLLDDVEVGFSPEEGDFPNLPESMVGEVWPLVFGLVAKVPLPRIDDIPYGGGKAGSAANSVTNDGTGVRDPSLDPAIKDNENQAQYAAQLAQFMFIGYLQSSHSARRLGELGDLEDISKGKGKFSQLAKQYLTQGNNYLLQSQKIRSNNKSLKAVQQKQKQNEKDQIGVSNGFAFPQGKELKINLAGAPHTGFFVGNNFSIKTRQHPEAEKYQGLETIEASDETTNPTYGRSTFFYADGGTPLILGTLPSEIIASVPDTHVNPVRYIVAGTIRVQVIALYAYRTQNDIKSLYPIPSNYYAVYQLQFGTLPVTVVYFYQPMSSRLGLDSKNEGWEDEIYATVQSPIGPNSVDIIQWLLQQYTHHTVDAASFAEVRALVNNYPSNFAVLDRPQAMTLVSEIARQARCMVWLKNNVFYIKYMPNKAAPIDVITEADIIEQSLEISYSESEDVISKVFATWRPDYITKPYYVILRYNISFYGLHERRDNYFIYNMQQLVEKSATFWLIRESNTFKRVTLKVPIKHLKIETMDTITLNFGNNYLANGPIDCLVEGASVDTNDYTITLTLWTPVRAGEMTEYPFAYTGGLTIQYVWPTAEDVQQGRAGGGNDFNTGVQLPAGVDGNPNLSKPFTGDPGNGGSLHVTHRPVTWGADPSYIPDQTAANQTAPQVVTRVDTASVSVAGKKPDGTTSYQVTRSKVKAATISGLGDSGITPAKIKAKDGDTYIVNAYSSGMSKPTTEVKGCIPIAIADGSEFPEGTPCFLIQFVYQDDQGVNQIENIIQPPVWA